MPSLFTALAVALLAVVCPAALLLWLSREPPMKPFTHREIRVLRIALERYLNDLDLARGKVSEDSDEFLNLELDMSRAEMLLIKLDSL